MKIVSHRLKKTFGVLLLILSRYIMDNKAFGRNSTTFASELYEVIVDGNKNSNIILSPFSIQTCLALAFAAAKGKTGDELKIGLHLESSDVSVVGDRFKNILDNYTNSSVLKIANKIYVHKDYSLNPQFFETSVQKFHSEVENIDFGESVTSANTINEWVETKTNKKIKNLISSDMLDDYTRAILVNAIHFKGLWAHKFKVECTRKEDFWTTETTSVPIDMMNGKAKYRYGMFDEIEATAVELPYKDCDLSMFILLPNKRDGLKNLESKLKSINLNDLFSRMDELEVTIKLPKFNIELSVELNEPLKKLGVRTMFTDNADFGNLLASGGDLSVSKVVHKAFIEVNEEGTEAAAATGLVIMLCSMPLEFEFFADHPFIYMIVDKNECIYFLGKYLSP